MRRVNPTFAAAIMQALLPEGDVSQNGATVMQALRRAPAVKGVKKGEGKHVNRRFQSANARYLAAVREAAADGAPSCHSAWARRGWAAVT